MNNHVYEKENILGLTLKYEANAATTATTLLTPSPSRRSSPRPRPRPRVLSLSRRYPPDLPSPCSIEENTHRPAGLPLSPNERSKGHSRGLCTAFCHDAQSIDLRTLDPPALAESHMQTNKDHGVKKKAQAALKSLFGRKKTPAGGGPPGSRASVQGCSPIADAEQKPPASSEPATTSANALVGPPGHPSAVAGNGTSGTDNAVQPSSFDSLPRVARQTRCRLELNEAIDEFRKNYVQFSKANREYILIDDELENVLRDIAAVDVKDIAKTFERNVTRTMRITERKKLLTENHWPTQVGHFLTKLYPVAKLSCSLMGAVAEVSPRQLRFNM